MAMSHGLVRWADELARAARLGWALRRVEPPDRPTRSQIGGLPLLRDGQDWPTDTDGVPMTHLAQIDLAELPGSPREWGDDALSRLAASGGLLQVFADLRDNRTGVNRAAVLQSRVEARPPAPVEVPVGLAVLPEHRVVLVPVVMVPEVWPGIRDSIWDEPAEPGADFQSWYDTLVPDDGPAHVFGGHPRSLQEDVRVFAALNAQSFIADGSDIAEVAAWIPLLRLEDDDALGLDIGDGGALNVLMPKVDLDAGRWQRLICVPESS
jgi:Domain of unknown function (DUF1963)